jgi:HK97 gp10 family phage protein
VTALEEIGLVAEGAAKRLCPVDTGRLRNSITHALRGDDSVAICTNVEYAIYVHEGTSRRKGVPFLRQAVLNNKSRFESILRKHIGG